MKAVIAGIVVLGLALAGAWALMQDQQEKKPAPVPASNDADLKQLKNLKIYD